jgi:prephenate dehydrogenase
MRRLAVLGGAGTVGGWAIEHLARPGDVVVTVDRTGEVHHSADVREPDAPTTAAVATADIVVLALPDDVAVHCLSWLGRTAPDHALILSTCSVQGPLFDRAAALGTPQKVVGAVPMFSPTLPSAGRPVVLVAAHQDTDVELVSELLTGSGMEVTVMTPEEYDGAASYLQVLAHAAVLSFLKALSQAPVDVTRLMAVAPPPARSLVALACRILTSPPEVYWDIQHDNPFGARRRQELTEALACLDEVVTEGRADDFRTELAAAADWLGPHLETGARDCRLLFRTLPTGPGGPAVRG